VYKSTIYTLLYRRTTHKNFKYQQKMTLLSSTLTLRDVMLRNINLFLIFNFTHGCAFWRWATTFRRSHFPKKRQRENGERRGEFRHGCWGDGRPWQRPLW